MFLLTLDWSTCLIVYGMEKFCLCGIFRNEDANFVDPIGHSYK